MGKGLAGIVFISVNWVNEFNYNTAKLLFEEIELGLQIFCKFLS